MGENEGITTCANVGAAMVEGIKEGTIDPSPSFQKVYAIMVHSNDSRRDYVAAVFRDEAKALATKIQLNLTNSDPSEFYYLEESVLVEC